MNEFRYYTTDQLNIDQNKMIHVTITKSSLSSNSIMDENEHNGDSEAKKRFSLFNLFSYVPWMASVNYYSNPPYSNEDQPQALVFVSIDNLPTRIDYEYVIESWSQPSLYILDTGGLKGKRLTLGIWGGKVAEDFDLLVEIIRKLFSMAHLTCQANCPNYCSNHGTCTARKCSCTPPWTGPDCSMCM